MTTAHSRSVTAPVGVAARRPTAGLLRVLSWAAAYVAATWLGDRTMVDDSALALFWPASGIALAWIATTPPRWRALELALVGALAGGSAYATDQTGGAVVAALVGLPLGLAVFVGLSRRWVPGLWGTGGTEPVTTLREYGLLLSAVVVAGSTEAVVDLLGLVPDPGLPFERAAELAMSRTVSMGAVGVTLLVIGGSWSRRLRRPRDSRLVEVRRGPGRTNVLLGVAAVVVTAMVFLVGFALVPDAPVSFVLVMALVLVGVRYGAALTGAYALAVVAAACWLTTAGQGPIAQIAEPHRQALAFGLFMTAMVGTGLTIALSRRERDATIDRLRESERAAEVLADDLSLVLANLEEGVAVVEEGGRFIHANPAIGRILGMPDFNAEHVESVETYHLVHPDGTPLLESEIPHVRAFAGEEDVHDVLHLSRPDFPGERIFAVSSRLLPQIRPTDLPRAVTTIRDVTAEHHQRDALASFAQVVAHDLRSPLTSVELWAKELLDTYADGPVDHETATMMLRHIESGAGRMQAFISDLLSYALARDQTPSPVSVELADVVESVVETIHAAEGTTPDVSHGDLPRVWCDPVLVPQLFDNLIGNARKYVADGVVSRVRIEAVPISEGWARVRVIDNGVGIAPEDRVRVFGTFERARASEYEGTGLGLAICRHIVERHGGTIGVTNPPNGSGTCIELTLPLTGAAFDRATTR